MQSSESGLSDQGPEQEVSRGFRNRRSKPTTAVVGRAAATAAPASGRNRSQLVQRLLDASANLPQFVHDLIQTQAVTVAGTEAAAFLIERRRARARGGRRRRRARSSNAAPPRPPAPRSSASARSPTSAPTTAPRESAPPRSRRSRKSSSRASSRTRTARSRSAPATTGARAAVLPRDAAPQRRQRRRRQRGHHPLPRPRARPAAADERCSSSPATSSCSRSAARSEQARTIAQSHQHVLQLATAVATAEGFESAAMNLCNELATRTGATRVSLGWVKGKQHQGQGALAHRAVRQEAGADRPAREGDGGVPATRKRSSSSTPTARARENVTREAQALSPHAGRATPSSRSRCAARRRSSASSRSSSCPSHAARPAGGQRAWPSRSTCSPRSSTTASQNDRWLITKAGISTREREDGDRPQAHAGQADHRRRRSASVVALIPCVPPADVPRDGAVPVRPRRSRSSPAPFEGLVDDVGDDQRRAASARRRGEAGQTSCSSWTPTSCRSSWPRPTGDQRAARADGRKAAAKTRQGQPRRRSTRAKLTQAEAKVDLLPVPDRPGDDHGAVRRRRAQGRPGGQDRRAGQGRRPADGGRPSRRRSRSS